MMSVGKIKSALVVEGGGMRGAFSAGVLHAFGKAGFYPYDMYIGVSAGACNLASYLAGQNDRNFDIMKRYSSTGRFINAVRFLKGGHYMDLDWLWDVTISECRLDLDRIFQRMSMEDRQFIVVATSMITGRPAYLRPDRQVLEHYLKASSAIPLLYRGTIRIGDDLVADGGIADPIPVIEAFRRGARRITVIRSRPGGYSKRKSRLGLFFGFYFRNFPGMADALQRRHDVYMEAVHFISSPPEGVEIEEITPDPALRVRRTSTGMEVLYRAYLAGIDQGRNYIHTKSSGVPVL